jgi:hypothetical protein
MTIIISLSTIVSASVSNSLKGASAKLEERLAQKAITDTWNKFTEYYIELRSNVKLWVNFRINNLKFNLIYQS